MPSNGKLSLAHISSTQTLGWAKQIATAEDQTALTESDKRDSIKVVESIGSGTLVPFAVALRPVRDESGLKSATALYPLSVGSASKAFDRTGDNCVVRGTQVLPELRSATGSRYAERHR